MRLAITYLVNTTHLPADDDMPPCAIAVDHAETTTVITLRKLGLRCRGVNSVHSPAPEKDQFYVTVAIDIENENDFWKVIELIEGNIAKPIAAATKDDVLALVTVLPIIND